MYMQASRGEGPARSVGRRVVPPPPEEYGGYSDGEEEEEEGEEEVGIRAPVPRRGEMAFDQVGRDRHEEIMPGGYGRKREEETRRFYPDYLDSQGAGRSSSTRSVSNRTRGRDTAKERNSNEERGAYAHQPRTVGYRPPPREASPGSQDEDSYVVRYPSPSYEDQENRNGPVHQQDLDDAYEESVREYSRSPDQPVYHEQDERGRFDDEPMTYRHQSPDVERDHSHQENEEINTFSDKALPGPDPRYSHMYGNKRASTLDQRRDLEHEAQRYEHPQHRQVPYPDDGYYQGFSSESEQEDYKQDMPLHPKRHSSNHPPARDSSAGAVHGSRTKHQNHKYREETETHFDKDELFHRQSHQSVARSARDRTQPSGLDESGTHTYTEGNDDRIETSEHHRSPRTRRSPSPSPSASDQHQNVGVDEYGYTQDPFQVTIFEPNPEHHGIQLSKDKRSPRTSRSPSPSPPASDQLQDSGVDEYGYTQAPFQVTILEPTPAHHRHGRPGGRHREVAPSQDHLDHHRSPPSQVTLVEPTATYHNHGHDSLGYPSEPLSEEDVGQNDMRGYREDSTILRSDSYRQGKRYRENYEDSGYEDHYDTGAETGTGEHYPDLSHGHQEPNPRNTVKKVMPIKNIAELDSLRRLVVVPEAKVQRNKDRMIESGVSANAILDLLLPSKPRKVSGQDKSKPGSKLATQITGRQAETKRQNDPAFKKTFGHLTSTTKGASTKVVKSSGQVKEDWRNHRSIQNPKWYTAAVSATSKPNTSPSSSSRSVQRQPRVIVGESVVEQRVIYKTLTDSGLDLVDEDGKIQFTDLVLSPKTAVIFHSLASLPTTDAALLKSVKRAAVYFQRIIVVFAVVPFRSVARGRRSESGDDKEVDTSPSPLSDAVIKALGVFKRAIALSVTPGEEDMIGVAEAVFAINGVEEVARVMKHVAEQDDVEISARIKQIKGGKGEQARWESKDWLHNDNVQDAEEEEVFLGAGFNLYSTRYLMGTFGYFDMFVDQYTEAQRLERVGPVVGTLVIERFHRVYKQRLIELEQMESTLYTSDPGYEETRVHM